MNKILLLSALLAATAAPLPAFADGPLKTRDAAAEAQAFQADRAAITPRSPPKCPAGMRRCG